MNSEFISIVRSFIDFLNLQIGAYTDACSGFEKNRTTVQRQVHRVLRKGSKDLDKDGRDVTVWTSLEEPSRPDVIHYRIVRADHFINENSPGGQHEQQHAKAILVFIYAYWENEIRVRLAENLKVAHNTIASEIMGELKEIRHAILHQKGILKRSVGLKLKKTAEFFPDDGPIIFTHSSMHKIFALIKQDLVRMINEQTGPLEGAPNPEEVGDIAIQYTNKR